jgi:hypothetical protein
LLIPLYNHDDVISSQETAPLEAFNFIVRTMDVASYLQKRKEKKKKQED